MQSACKKEEASISPEEKEFISKLKGEWTVQQFSRTNITNFTTITLTLLQDTLYFDIYPDTISEFYSIYDLVICTLPCIENIQNWTITENNDSLILKTQDFCDDSDYFNIYYNDLKYKDESEVSGVIIPANYSAYMQLVNQDTVIASGGFLMLYTGTQIEFVVLAGDYSNSFSLLRHP